MTGPLPRILVLTILLMSMGLPPCQAQDVPIEEAGLEWQLLGRSVARIHSPRHVGTGFLISNECMLTSARVVEGTPIDRIEIYFSDPLNGAAVAGSEKSPILFDRWRALSVEYISLEGCAPGAIIRVAPKAGLYAGEEYGYLGARLEEPMPGEPAHAIAFAANGHKTYVHADALYDAEVGLTDTGGPLSFCFRADAYDSGDGAPILGDGGCLIGIQCASNPGQAWAVNINSLRQAMPDGGCPLETCQLEVEQEYHFGSLGDVPQGMAGVNGAHGADNQPRVANQSPRRTYAGHYLRGLPDRGVAPFDYPDVPPGQRDIDPPTPPESHDSPTSPDPCDPQTPPDPRDPTPRVPEPGALLLLLCGAAIFGRGRMRKGGAA